MINNITHTNTTPLNKYLQRIIIDFIINHDQYIDNKYSKHNRSSQNKIYNNIFRLSLVSKSFYIIITTIYKSLDIFEMMDLVPLPKPSNRFINNKLSNQKSLYSFNNINQLILDFNRYTSLGFKNNIMELIDLFDNGNKISNTNNNSSNNSKTILEKVIIKIENKTSILDNEIPALQQVNEIVEKLVLINPNIQVQIILHDCDYLSYSSSFGLDKNMKSLGRFNSTVSTSTLTSTATATATSNTSCIIKPTIYKTNIWLNDDAPEDFFMVIRFLEFWNIDTIITDYEYDDLRSFANFSLVFTGCNLKKYKLNELFYLPSLTAALKSNSNLESLDVYIDYSAQIQGVNNHECDLEKKLNFNIKMNNTHHQWLEFCNSISESKSLKKLKLRNGCEEFNKAETQHSSSGGSTGLSDDYLERIECFSSIFRFNKSITHLVLQNFDDLIIKSTLNEILSSNNTITSITLYPDNNNNNNINHLNQSLSVLIDIIKSKSNIRQIKIFSESFDSATLDQLIELCNINSKKIVIF